MALESYIAIKGSKQGQFKGGSTKHGGRSKWSSIIAFDFGVESPRDQSTGAASGKRQHNPLKVTKQTDSASPQLFESCVTNETLQEVVIEVVDPSLPDPKRVVRRIVLTDATIQRIMPHIGRWAGQDPTMRDYTITCGTIEDQKLRWLNSMSLFPAGPIG